MTPIRMVVAYDDSPERYTLLAQQCRRLGWAFACVEHPEALRQVLDNHDVIAVLLDHDLRDVEGEVCTGVNVAHDVLVGRCVPVIVSSANRIGAKNIAAVLHDAAIPHKVISCLESATEERWLGALALYAAVRP